MEMFWWYKIFGSRRYKWLLKKAKYYGLMNYKLKELQKVYWMVIETWNPLDKNLKNLEDAVSLIKKDVSFFSLDFICQCFISIELKMLKFKGPREEFITAWRIIVKMLDRMILDENLDVVDINLRIIAIEKCIRIIENIALNLEHIKLETDIVEAKTKELQDKLAALIKQEPIWEIFYSMVYLVNAIYRTIHHKYNKPLFTYYRVFGYIESFDKNYFLLLQQKFDLQEYLSFSTEF